LSVVFCIFFCQISGAQIDSGGEAGTDSISTAFIPIAGFNSDIGLLFGGVFSRFDYTGDSKPFNNLWQVNALVSTKGFINAEGRYEKTDGFGKEIRAVAEAEVFRFSDNSFFGTGNNTTFSRQLFDDEFYFFESFSLGFEYKLRKTVYENWRAQLDITGGIGFNYHNPEEALPNSTFTQIRPNGAEGGAVNFLTGGMIWENRDSEFDPHTGNRAELEVRYAPEHLSEFALTTFRLDLRQYVHLFNNVTVAGRVEGRHAGGDVPFWELSTLGNELNLRGFPLNRFQGNSSVAYNLELRTWLIELPENSVKIGVHFFTDGGRVFTEQNNFTDLFENFHHTVGVGGAFSAFIPDFILRGEVGFSDEVARVYIGVGYLF